ncbi:MAG TPA: sulfatase [Polyangiaceae bacterium]|nr:sulfatase [Polyangiaceae bacterium]
MRVHQGFLSEHDGNVREFDLPSTRSIASAPEPSQSISTPASVVSLVLRRVQSRISTLSVRIPIAAIQWLPRVHHAGWLGYVLGGIDAMLVAGNLGGGRRLRLVLGGASGGAFVAVALIVSSLCVLRLWKHAASLLRVLPRMAACRRPGQLIAGLTAGGLGVTAFVTFLSASARITVAPLRTTLLELVAAVCIALVVVAMWQLEPVIERWGEPWLSRVAASAPIATKQLLLIVAPTVGTTVYLVTSYGDQLGILRRALLVASFLVIERWTYFLCWRLRRRRNWQEVAPYLLALGTITGPFLFRSGSVASQKAHQGKVLGDVLQLIHYATDFDRDGFSSVFGGRDCAAFSSSRYPGALEIPNNGVDENCDGVDGVGVGAGDRLEPKFLGSYLAHKGSLNVIWYVVDSLRADHLTMHGYWHDTSPTLEALASESWFFEQAYSQASTTALSMPSMFAGRNPSSMRFSRNGFPLASAEEFYLAREFEAKGYRTYLLANDWVRTQLPGLQHGFGKIISFPPEMNWRSGDRVLESLTTILNGALADERPFFVVAHIDDVHHPYKAAEGTAIPMFPSPGEQAGYDRGIALFDRALATVLEELKRTKLWERTIIIITADHGEEFGEHGGGIHSRTCYEEVTHVPLVLRMPGEHARRVGQRVALIDLAPTLLELLGGDYSAVPLDGQSLLVPIFAPELAKENRPVFCSIYDVMPGRSAFFNRSVRAGRWSLHEEVISGRVELYDLVVDQAERQNLAEVTQYQRVREELLQLFDVAPQGNLFRISQGLE